MKTGKYLVIIVAVLLLILPAIAFMILQSIDFNSYKPLIQKQVMKFSGRTFSIGGDIELDIGFNSRLAVSDVNLSNAAWSSHETMISIKHVECRSRIIAPHLRRYSY